MHPILSLSPNVPRKILDKMFRLKSGLTFKTYATLEKFNN